MCAGLNGARALPSMIGKRFSGLVRRLHAEHELEVFGARVVPGEPAFRLEEHRVDGLRFEFAVEHQQRRIVRGQFGADLLAIGRGLGVGRPGLDRERRPDRALGVLKLAGTDPAGQDRRIDIGRLGRRPGHAGKAVGAIVRHHDGAGLLGEFHEAAVAQS